ncbi:MAG: penicillin-binding protein activator LpoB [Alphaproteobacteria bacterium]
MSLTQSYIQSILLGVILSALLFTTGCQTTGARYVEAGGIESIVSLNQINPQDWMNAADQMVQSLITSGVLEQSERQPVVLAVSRIVNDTLQRVDTDTLIKKIRVALNKTGKVVTTTTLAVGGRVEDPLAKDVSEYKNFMNDQPQKFDAPDYSLSGKLLEQRASSGSDRQVNYTFQLSLTHTSTGYAVWEDEVNIQKIGRRSSVGW